MTTSKSEKGKSPPAQERPLTGKEEAFCQEYVTCWNGTRSAIEAKYSKKTAAVIASENLRKPKIRTRIQEILAEKIMAREEVLARLAAEARANLADLVEFYNVPVLDKDGHHVGDRQSVRIKKDAFEKYGYLIKSITPTASGDFKVELVDAQKAKELIGRHHNLFRETRLNVDLTKLTDEQLERIAAGEDPVKVLSNA